MLDRSRNALAWALAFGLAAGSAFAQPRLANPGQDLTPDGRFDVVIDDASHLGALSRASFDFLFPNGLKDKGLYFAEDFGTGYNPQFGGTMYTPPPPLNLEDNVFPSHETGMVGWLKQLVDEVTVGAYFSAIEEPRKLASCHFWPNIALIQKL